MFENILFIDEEYIRDYGLLNGNVDTTEIMKSVYFIQDLHVMPVLGTTFNNELLTKFSGGTANADELALIEYIKPVVLHFTVAAVSFFTSLNLKNKGIVRSTGDFTEAVDNTTILLAKTEIEKRGEFYKNRLINYLCANASLFPTYQSSTNQNTDMVPQTPIGYSSNVGFYNSRWNRYYGNRRNII